MDFGHFYSISYEIYYLSFVGTFQILLPILCLVWSAVEAEDLS